MYNHIRKVPYVTGDGKGGITYFAGGFSNQFGIETQIIAAVCEFSLRFLRSPANNSRRCLVLCNDFARSQGAKNEGCTNSTDCCYYLGIGHLWHVQFFDERL